MNLGAKGKRLVLHFDVNKTIIMKDTCIGLSSVTMTVRIIIHLLHNLIYSLICRSATYCLMSFGAEWFQKRLLQIKRKCNGY